MSDVWSTVGVFLLGGVGWGVTSFGGGPFRRFFDLRSEVIHKAVLYANVAASYHEEAGSLVRRPVEISEGDRARLREAEDTFRDLAARMRAFALNEPFAVRLVWLWRYDPMQASICLLRIRTPSTPAAARDSPPRGLLKSRFTSGRRPPRVKSPPLSISVNWTSIGHGGGPFVA